MPEMSGKCKSNPTKTNNLIYIMIFFQGGKKKFGALRAPQYKNLPPYRILIYAPDKGVYRGGRPVKGEGQPPLELRDYTFQILNFSNLQLESKAPKIEFILLKVSIFCMLSMKGKVYQYTIRPVEMRGRGGYRGGAGGHSPPPEFGIFCSYFRIASQQHA